MFRIPDTARLLTTRRTGVAAACLAMTALVAGCGGGDRVKPFQPSQIIAFGDETSAFDDTATAPLMSNRLVQFNTSTANEAVPYTARYTINVIDDGFVFFCKTSAPNPNVSDLALIGACPTPSVDLVTADYPSNLPTPLSYLFASDTNVATVAGNVRLASGTVPIVNEVITGNFYNLDTGALIPSPIPSPVYVSADHIYRCSLDFGNVDYGNWVQRLAHGLGGSPLSLGSAGGGCAQDVGNGRSYAAWGAKVDDVDAQVSANIGALRDGVLVTMLAGQNDVMDAFLNVQTTPANYDSAHKLMRDKGAQLAGIINRIVGTGARVVYLTVPNMGGAPAAVANPGLATSLTHAFNEGYKGGGEGNESGGLVLSVINNGHKIVKVDGYNQIGSLSLSYGAVAACETTDATKVKMPNGVAVSTVLDAAFPGQSALPVQSQSAAYRSAKAKALLLNCRSNNLAVVTARNLSPGASQTANDDIRGYYGNYLWADDQRLAPIGHAALSNLAVARIRDQL